MTSSPDPHAFPTPGAALLLTLTGFLVMLFVVAPLAVSGHVVAGLAAGMVLGFGGVGTLAARRVPAPAELRIGLCGFPLQQLLLVLMLAPLVLWLSELENLVALWLERPEAPEPGTEPTGDGPLSIRHLRTLEITLFVVLLRPVVEEFFFRGVVQQGAVAHLGVGRGLLMSTLLFTATRALGGAGNEYAFVVLTVQGLFEGGVLGGLRLATGSLLPGMLLQGLIGSVGLLAVSFADTLPIQGFNTHDGHTHPLLIGASGLVLGYAVLVMRALYAKAEPLPPAPEPEPPEEEPFG